MGRLGFVVPHRDAKTEMNERNVISAPPGILSMWACAMPSREEALMCVMLGTNVPYLQAPVADHPIGVAKAG